MKEAIYEAIRRCDTMRLRFVMGKKLSLLQYVTEKSALRVEEWDYSDMTIDEAEEKLKDWLGNLGTWVAGEENVLVCDGLHTCEGKEYYQFRLRGWVYDHATTLTWYVISKDGTDMFEGQCINGKLDRW